MAKFPAAGKRPVEWCPVVDIFSQKLDRLFNPRRVAVLGVAESSQRVGYNVLESIIYGGFTGEIYPVHPRLDSLQGLKVYHDLASLPAIPDVAVIALNQRSTVEALEKCARLGVPSAICLAGGFREVGPQGRVLEERLVEICAHGRMAVTGPNTLGLINTAVPFYATFYPLRLKPGHVSLICQSGGIGLTMLMKAMDVGLGINKFITVGNRSVLDVVHYLAYLEDDPGTHAIGVFLEGVEDARGLVQLAARVAGKKPLVVYKAGRVETSAYAAITHTGSMVGSFALYRDAFHQYGVFTVDSAPEVISALQALTAKKFPSGRRVAIMTHTAGPSIALMDHLAPSGAVFPPFSPATISAIKEVMGADPAVIIKNPLDAAGLGLNKEFYGKLTGLVLDDPGIDLVIVIYCLHKNFPFPTSELMALAQRTDKPLLCVYVSTQEGVVRERPLLSGAGIPLYISLEEAAVAAEALMFYSSKMNYEISVNG